MGRDRRPFERWRLLVVAAAVLLYAFFIVTGGRFVWQIQAAIFTLTLCLAFHDLHVLWRFERRIKHGQCTECGYPIGTSPVCTECGLTLPGAA